MSRLVAPHAGAWIEIIDAPFSLQSRKVAPHAGAWIEITDADPNMATVIRRTPCGCVD